MQNWVFSLFVILSLLYSSVCFENLCGVAFLKVVFYGMNFQHSDSRSTQIQGKEKKGGKDGLASQIGKININKIKHQSNKRSKRSKRKGETIIISRGDSFAILTLPLLPRTSSKCDRCVQQQAHNQQDCVEDSHHVKRRASRQLIE